MTPPLRWLTLALVLCLVGWFFGCEGAEGRSAEIPPRHQRFGIFRDLVLIERPAAEGGPFYLDRFETTVADWSAYLAATEQTTMDEEQRRDSRPYRKVSLPAARRYAHWRFCRLPRRAEWDYAATQGHSRPYPWGLNWTETWANTRGLKSDRVVPVGSFESGRSPGGPYDLIGNVAEWTETVDLWHEVTRPDGVEEFVYELPGEYAVAHAFGLRCWLPAGMPVPLEWLVMAEDLEVPRLVLGGSYVTSVGKSRDSQVPWFPVPLRWLPEQYSPTTGVRLAASPTDLLRALVGSGARPTEGERALLVRFLRVPGNRRALGVAWRWLRDRASVAGSVAGPLAALLDAELVP